ncbi:two-component system, OmpR family, phosphate regulon sensor histidine kinase PhoR [Paracoccus aminovorans]|uniref:histidine kinase n=1 Tax=Paracoccus aminovorans TaxID=34004 RepID=A0A1I2Y750_9RHOB|nr:ATP-binding protein [Paracoccus aminovorans]CQR86064.1 two-component system, OmpR family, phosphate regulon sensor histidine kinase PhoR [Paracoccus aminovorans]SFH20171.1 two-component system, OmpR family, phosphate regulon sensor histidine kinase PhoR [Paracoccus aminovorans]
MIEARLHALLRGVPVPMLVADAQSRIIGANEPAEALLGPVPGGRPFVTVLRQPEVNAALDAVLAGRQDRARLSLTLGAAERRVFCEVTVTALDAPGLRGATVAIEDRSRDEETEQMRRDFVANVSHELRTPLTALMGFIETLRGPARNDPAARSRFLDIMEREAGRMNRLVADLLSLSRVEQDERRRPAQAVDLGGLLRGVVATLTPAAAAAGVRLELAGTGTTAAVPGDADQLVQVFHNLIENALKYGAGGSVVTVTLAHLAHEPVLRGPAWSVSVADRGEGIDPQHLPRLTERFYRVDTHRSREQGGTGLGLAIVKHIVNRHRGRLRIESTRGQGSRFTVILPEKIGRI